MDARQGETIDLRAIDLRPEPASHVHKSAAETGLLRQSQVSSCDRSGIAEGIPKGPHRLRQSLRKNVTAFGDLLPSQFLGCPRENRVGERMGADTHSRSGQLPQPRSIKRQEPVGKGRVLEELLAPVLWKPKLFADLIQKSAPEFSIELRKPFDQVPPTRVFLVRRDRANANTGFGKA